MATRLAFIILMLLPQLVLAQPKVTAGPLSFLPVDYIRDDNRYRYSGHRVGNTGGCDVPDTESLNQKLKSSLKEEGIRDFRMIARKGQAETGTIVRLTVTQLQCASNNSSHWFWPGMLFALYWRELERSNIIARVQIEFIEASSGRLLDVKEVGAWATESERTNYVFVLFSKKKVEINPEEVVYRAIKEAAGKVADYVRGDER